MLRPSHVAGPATAKALDWTCAPPRIGVLGIARIAPLALIKPASGSVLVAVVAAREVSRVARMDAGCCAVHMARTFGGATPEAVSAQAKLRDPEVDRAMTAKLKFPGGHTGGIRCSMWSSDLLNVSARVVGDHGELRVLNPVVPQLFHRLPPLACVSARRFRRGSAARASGQDDAKGRGREHERDRRDLLGRRAPIAQPEPNMVAASGSAAATGQWRRSLTRHG